MCVFVRVEMVLLLNYCLCRTVGAELLLLLSNYCRNGNRHVCVVVGAELLLPWS